MGIKELAKRIVHGNKADSDRYIAHLRKLGMSIGEDVVIFAPTKTTIDEQYPWMIEIGNHVRISQGVVMLTHDYAWSVLKSKKNGVILGASGKVTIGDNVFIGMNVVITRGVTIGNHVIIGTGSVVTRDCLDSGVYAGNPARRISDIDTYFEKRKAAQLEEARELAIQYFRRYGKKPGEEVFCEYFMLFEDAESAKEKDWCVQKLELCGNYQESLGYMRSTAPLFCGFDAFLDYCLNGENAL